MKYKNIILENLSVLYKKGALHIFIGSVTSQFIAFFGSIFLVRILSKEEFGYLSYIENLYGYVYVLAGFGLAHAVLRFIIKSDTVSKEFGVYGYVVKRSLLINFSLFFVVTSILLLYPHPQEFLTTNKIIWIIVLSLPAQYLVETNHFTLRAILKNKYYAYSALVIGVLLVSSRVTFSLIWGVQGALIARLLVYSVAALLLTYILKNRYFNNSSISPLSNNETREINRFSFQYMITSSIWIIFMLNDTFLLGRILGNSDIVAEYRVAYFFPANLSLISTSIGIFVGPYFVKNENNYKWVWSNYKKLLMFSFAVVLPVSILLILLTRHIIFYVYGSQYLGIVDLMRILTVSSLINSVFRYTTAHLLSVMGKVKYNMIVSICGVILQVALNIILIPRFGVYGPAYTSILVYTLMSTVLFFIFFTIYRRN